MDWENERYVRVYTRDTVTWKLLSWQARALFVFILRAVDRAGVVDTGNHEAHVALSALCAMPADIVAEALPELVSAGVVEDTGEAVIVPNFLDAQEAKASDAQRQRESRARRRDRARRTRRDEPPTPSSHLVTERDGGSREVTDRHDLSHAVTPSLASLTNHAAPRRDGVTSSRDPVGRAGLSNEIRVVRAVELITTLPGSAAAAPYSDALKAVAQGWVTADDVEAICTAVATARATGDRPIPSDWRRMWWFGDIDATKREWLPSSDTGQAVADALREQGQRELDEFEALVYGDEGPPTFEEDSL